MVLVVMAALRTVIRTKPLACLLPETVVAQLSGSRITFSLAAAVVVVDQLPTNLPKKPHPLVAAVAPVLVVVLSTLTSPATTTPTPWLAMEEFLAVVVVLASTAFQETGAMQAAEAAPVMSSNPIEVWAMAAMASSLFSTKLFTDSYD